MPISCSQCREPIGGHDPKCVVDGGWWCERCVYELERFGRDVYNTLLAEQKRRAALAAGEDV